MLEKSGADVDPAIFRAGNQEQFSRQLVEALETLESANETVRVFEGYNPEASGREWGLDIEDSGDEEVKEAYDSLIEHGGEDLIHGLMGRISDRVHGDPEQEEVTEEEHEAAARKKLESSERAINLICGYKEFMQDGIAKAYGGEDEEIEEQAWSATWKKLKDILTEAQGTLLVEAVVLVDEIAQEHFGSDYDPQEHDRGPVVSANVCARTFYKILQPHLPRATMRSGEDEWTGF